ncbi:MAG: hypothetical protein IT175_11760 [Acidobacteria bacterium]|nr:hypothetical protein [Acidobacteriota bacterium]
MPGALLVLLIGAFLLTTNVIFGLLASKAGDHAADVAVNIAIGVVFIVLAVMIRRGSLAALVAATAMYLLWFASFALQGGLSEWPVGYSLLRGILAIMLVGSVIQGWGKRESIRRPELPR